MLARRTCLALAAVLLGAILVLPGHGTEAEASPSAQKKRWYVKTGAKFNVPRSEPDTQFRLERQILGAIRHAKKGSKIRMAMFSFDRYPVVDALIAAKKRGVSVQVLVNDHERTPAQRKLAKALGTNPAKKNFIYQCYKGCRSGGNILHSKFYLFKETGASRWVVMLGSINMKMNGHRNQYNDLFTLKSKKVFHRFTSLFNEMRKDTRAKPTFVQQHLTKKYMIQATPYGGSWKKDPLNYHLRRVGCQTPKVKGGRTIVRVNMHAWDGDRGRRIAQAVRDLYAKGCNVRVQYGYGGKQVRDVFATPTKRGLVPVRSSGLDTSEDEEIDLYTHTKLLMIKGRYGKKALRNVVVTGSSNYQNDGIHGDELLFRVFKKSVYEQYLDHFNWMWNERTRSVYYYPSAGSSSARLAPISRQEANQADPEDLPELTIAEPLGINSPEWKNE